VLIDNIMTAVKYELLPFPIDYEIWTADVVRRTDSKCEQYIVLHAPDIPNRIRNGYVHSDTGYCTFTDTNVLNSV